VQLLLARGADPNSADRAGRTALDVATRHNPRHPLAELFRRSGAKD